MGEPGIGKTTMLKAARSRADGMQVIAAVGIEAEATLPFAALGEIAEPLLEHRSALAPHLAEAIDSALALAPSAVASGDRLTVCIAFLELLRAAAAERPLLVLVDDSQWLDSASAECVSYAARRLEGAPVALLATTRDLPERTQLTGEMPELSLSGLDRGEARELLRAAVSELADSATESLLDAADGNPLALIELPGLLSAAQRQGSEPIAEVPVPRSGLRAAFERRCEALDPPARQAAIVAAASFDRRRSPVRHACEELGLPGDSLAQAEAAAVLSASADVITFAHPLLRGVVYEGASGPERRRAHKALARHADDDARAWHLAAAAIGPDAEVAAALEAAGGRAAARGAHSAAADALERAAELSDDPGVQAGRTFAAALAAAVGGRFERATALLEPIAEDDDSQMQTPVRHLLSVMALTAAMLPARENHRRLSEEAERTLAGDPAMATAMHADAAMIAVVAGDCPLALDSAERAISALPADAPPTLRCHALSIWAMAIAVRGRIGEANAAYDEAAELLGQVDPYSPATASISFAMHSMLCTGRAADCRERELALIERAREIGSHGLVPYGLLVAADAAYRLGDWDAAAQELTDSVEIAEHSAQLGPLSIALGIKARLSAACGDHTSARAEAARGIATAAAPGYGATDLWARAALGFLELGQGRVAEAIAELEYCERCVADVGLEEPVIVPWAPDLVEAYARAGRERDAARISAALDAEAKRSGVALATAFAARCRGLVAAEAFDREFELALEAHDRDGSPFERARTLLAWGSKLHRARRRVEARERLHEALAGFESLAAAPWAERAAAEIGAADAPARKADPDELTAQELRVATAVARGATNREVASELFLSPKTIEFHLSRVYRKLEIGSRAELASLVADGRLPTSEPPPRQAVG